VRPTASAASGWPRPLLVLAWAIGRGRRWARIGFPVYAGVLTLTVLGALSAGAARYAPADLAAGLVLWLVAMAALTQMFQQAASPFFRRQPAGV
jgi:uncharacterized membrane protein